MCNRWYGKDPCAHIKDLSLCVALCLQPSITTLCEIISKGDKLLEALCQNIGNLMFKNISTKADCTRTTLHQTPSLLNVHPPTWKLASVTLPFLAPLQWVVISIRDACNSYKQKTSPQAKCHKLSILWLLYISSLDNFHRKINFITRSLSSSTFIIINFHHHHHHHYNRF